MLSASSRNLKALLFHFFLSGPTYLTFYLRGPGNNDCRYYFGHVKPLYSDHVIMMIMVFLLSRTSKSRAKRDKKRFSLKQGSPYEEFALVEALRNLVEQTTTWKGSTSLLLASVNHWKILLFHLFSPSVTIHSFTPHLKPTSLYCIMSS